MNHFIRVLLRLIVCLYFGFSSAAAYSYGLNSRGDPGYDYTLDYLITEAWECDPVFHGDKIVNWQVGPKYTEPSHTRSEGWDFTDEFETQLLNTVLEFRGCSDQAINDKFRGRATSNQVREYFIHAYVTFDYGFNGLFSVSPKYQDSRFRPMMGSASYINRSRDDLIILQVKVSPSFYQDQKRHEEVVREREELRLTKQRELDAKKAAEVERKRQDELAQQALMIRANALKSGAEKVASLSDAILLNDPASLLPLMDSPLLTPDGKYYVGNVLVEAQEGALIRVQGALLMGQMGELASKTYAYLKLPKDAMNFSAEGMRIGGTTSIVGKYVGNINYNTVSGVTKTAPVIECSYYAAIENNNDRLRKLINRQLGQ